VDILVTRFTIRILKNKLFCLFCVSLWGVTTNIWDGHQSNPSPSGQRKTRSETDRSVTQDRPVSCILVCLLPARQCSSPRKPLSGFSDCFVVWHLNARIIAACLSSYLNIPSELNWLSIVVLRRSCLRHCAVSRKVAGSIPDGVTGIFRWHNPSGRTMVVGLTQSLTEIGTKNISWGG
jgi:hypothetical protein